MKRIVVKKAGHREQIDAARKIEVNRDDLLFNQFKIAKEIEKTILDNGNYQWNVIFLLDRKDVEKIINFDISTFGRNDIRYFMQRAKTKVEIKRRKK